MKKSWALVLLLALVFCALIPSAGFTEDRDTVLLARTIYALGKNETYQTKLALGSVVMNRVESPWFDNTLGDVLRDQQQFPAGSRYDDESLKAAHALLTGERTLDADALYYQAADASAKWSDANRIASAGNYNFYSAGGND